MHTFFLHLNWKLIFHHHRWDKMSPSFILPRESCSEILSLLFSYFFSSWCLRWVSRLDFCFFCLSTSHPEFSPWLRTIWSTPVFSGGKPHVLWGSSGKAHFIFVTVCNSAVPSLYLQRCQQFVLPAVVQLPMCSPHHVLELIHFLFLKSPQYCFQHSMCSINVYCLGMNRKKVVVDFGRLEC